MKRIPIVTAAKKSGDGPMVEVHSVKRGRTAKVDGKNVKAVFGTGEFGWNTKLNIGGTGASSYRNSYSNFGNTYSGTVADVPQYFSMLNENNGGIFYWPVTLKEKYEWYRYFYRCFVNPDTLVTMFDGTQRKMSELKIGDEIINAFGEKINVSAQVTNEYCGDIYKIELENGNLCENEVTADHLYYVYEKDRMGGEPSWRRADELRAGDYMVSICILGNGQNLDSTEKTKHVKTVRGNWTLTPIKKITCRPYKGNVYCITTNGENYDSCSFVANGFVTHNCDPYVKQAVNLLTDLPMSKLVLRMPKMKDLKKRDMILAKYQNMVKRIKLFDRLHTILFELNIIGNAFAFVEFDETKKEWSKIVLLPPEEVTVAKYPMSDQSKVMYIPELINQIIGKYDLPLGSVKAYEKFVSELEGDDFDVMKNIPYDFAKQVAENSGKLEMDTDPFTGDGGHKIGSFVYHFADKRHDYYDLGVSPLECVLIPLLMKEHYKYTQLSLASRNMTPRSKISAPSIGPEALEQLRLEVDQSMLNPDYVICTNYDWQWEMIGADNRLIDLSKEYETINEQFFAGLGVTREILTGEGMYSGNKISVELLNTRFMFKREMLSAFVEESLFLPVAEENGYYEVDEFGNKNYFYPKLSFTRLSIRDNAEVFDSLFQLYQKGSLPIDVILDLFNIDGDEVHEKLKEDMFTVKDAQYNEMLRSIYSDIASKITENTDLADQVTAYMKGPDGKPLKKVQQEEEGGEGDGYDDGGDYEEPAQEEPAYDDEQQDYGDGQNEETEEDVRIEENTDGNGQEENDPENGEDGFHDSYTGSIEIDRKPHDIDVSELFR